MCVCLLFFFPSAMQLLVAAVVCNLETVTTNMSGAKPLLETDTFQRCLIV